MNNQQAVVEQIIQNLAFEVEAVPKNTNETTDVSQTMPLNVKIRVRKKDTQHEVPSYPLSGEIQSVPEKIRLVSSDQTIMTFDVFMEAEFEKQTSQKPRKHILDILRPGICLGDTNDHDNSYIPSSSYTANITEPSVTTKPDGVLKQNFTLLKNTYQDYNVSTQDTGGQKWIFGRCKPGGCLDPPFSEDKYSYKPSIKQGGEQITTEPNTEVKEKLPNDKKCATKDKKIKTGDEQITTEPNDLVKEKLPEDKKKCITTDQKIKTGDEQIFPEPNLVVKEKLPNENKKCVAKGIKRPSKVDDGDNKSNGRQNSIFDSGIFKKKRKCSDKSTNTKLGDNETDKTDSILNIYPVKSPDNSLSTHSNSIITYPPKLSSDLGICIDKSVKSRGPSEDKSRKSFNEHSEPYFIPPKRVNRIKENDTIYQKDNPKHSLSDVPDSRNTTKDSFKVPIPIPIPISIPFGTNKQNLESTTVTGESSGTINQNETLTPDQKVCADLPTEDTKKVINSFEKVAPDSNHIDSFKQVPTTPNIDSFNLDDGNSSCETVPQPDKNNKGTENLEEKNKTNLPLLPIPIPINLGSREPNQADNVVTNNNINKDIETTDMNKIKSEYKDNIISHIKENKKDSEDFNQDTVTGKISLESECTFPALTPGLEDSKLGTTETDSIPKNYLQSSQQNDQKNDPIKTDNFFTKIPIKEGDIIGSASKEKNTAGESGEAVKKKLEKNEEDKSTKFDDTSSSSKDYLEEKSDGHMLPDIKDYQKKFQNEKPELNASKTSEASIEVNTIKNVSTDKPYEEDHIDSDISLCEPEDEANKENISASTKPQNIQPTQQIVYPSNDNKGYTYDDGLKQEKQQPGSFITAPVFIDKIEQSPYFRPLKEVNSETNLLSEPKDHGQSDSKSKSQIPLKFKKFDDDNMAQSSHELVGIKSVIYDTEEDLPLTSSKKNTEKSPSLDKQDTLPSNAVKGSSDIISSSSKTSAKGVCAIDEDLRNKRLKDKTKSTSSVLSHITSTNNLKSALKKDTFSVELGFQSYLNDKNERILKTFDFTCEPKSRYPNDSVTVIKSHIRISSNEIRIPIDSDHDLSMQIKKPTANQRVSISESGFVNTPDNSRKIKQKSSIPTNGGEKSTPEVKECDEIVESDAMDYNVLDLYEHELVPLQLIIKNLRDEIDVLAAQQMLYRDKIFCPKKSKLPRLVNSNKKCFGCLKK